MPDPRSAGDGHRVERSLIKTRAHQERTDVLRRSGSSLVALRTYTYASDISIYVVFVIYTAVRVVVLAMASEKAIG